MPQTGVVATDTRGEAGEASNRRQFDRVVCRVNVTLESETTFYNGFTENISAGGLFIATYDTRPLGETVTLEFTLPERKEPLVVTGEIRWLREYNDMTPDIIPGMGVRFLDLKEQDRKAIEGFIALKEPLFYDE